MKVFLGSFVGCIIMMVMILAMVDAKSYAFYRERIFGQEGNSFTIGLGDCKAVDQLTVWQNTGRVEMTIMRGIDPSRQRVLLEPNNSIERC